VNQVGIYIFSTCEENHCEVVRCILKSGKDLVRNRHMLILAFKQEQKFGQMIWQTVACEV